MVKNIKPLTFTLLIIMMLVLLGLAFYGGFQFRFKTMTCSSQTCISFPDRRCAKHSLFEEAVSKIGDRAYTDEYKCLDFSKDLIEELEKIGIRSNIAINKERTHAWVVVWVEATTGGFTLPEEDLEILELRDREMNVICK